MALKPDSMFYDKALDCADYAKCIYKLPISQRFTLLKNHKHFYALLCDMWFKNEKEVLNNEVS